MILGPVGVGKTHLACALGHIAVRRRRTVHMAPAAKLFKRLKAARLDNTLDAEMRRLAGVDLLILDDFALQPLDATETADFYQLCVERHQRASTVVTSNRTAEEWLSMMADPLLAQSAVDRLASTAHELIIEGESYRRRQKPSINHSHDTACPLTTRKETTMITHDPRWSLPRGNTPVPSRWQATVPDAGRCYSATRLPALQPPVLLVTAAALPHVAGLSPARSTTAAPPRPDRSAVDAPSPARPAGCGRRGKTRTVPVFTVIRSSE